MSKNDRDAFRELSAVLTGFTNLSPATAARHLKTLQHALGAKPVAELLGRFRTFKGGGDQLVKQVRTELFGDAVLGPVVRQVTLLWFTGLIANGDAPPALMSADDYFEALMWPAIGSHPPAFSDGYFGHWRNPADMGS